MIVSKEERKTRLGVNTVLLSSQAKTKSLFSLLGSYLEINDAQNKQLADSRSVATELDSTYTTTLTLLNELQKRLEQDALDLDQAFMQVAQILNPSQLAKFVIWVTNNPACMHMLNALWTKTMDPADGTKKTEGGGEGEKEENDGKKPAKK